LPDSALRYTLFIDKEFARNLPNGLHFVIFCNIQDALQKQPQILYSGTKKTSGRQEPI